MASPTTPEPLTRIKDAASQFQVPYRKLLNAVKRGFIPSYVFEGIRYVRVSDIETHIQQSRHEVIKCLNL